MGVRNSAFRYWLYHLGFWLLLGGLWYFLRYQDYSTTEKALQVTVVKVLDLALMVYIANYLLIPKLLYKKKYALFVVCFLTMVAASSGWKMYIIGRLINNPALYHWSGQLKTRIYDNVLPHIFLVIAGMAVKLLTDYNQAQKRLLQTAREKAETELAFLKAQINPHFLFNSLNAVYFLIDKENTEARAALHTFSDMLRYQLYEVGDEKIPIEKELHYLEHYIALQKLRNENCDIHLSVHQPIKSFLIEPMLLLPFIENSFKHVSHFGNGSKNEINIALAAQNGSMTFNVKNTTDNAIIPTEPGGIGLANVKRRLELLYPKKHQLTVDQTDGWFNVHLQLKLDR